MILDVPTPAVQPPAAVKSRLRYRPGIPWAEAFCLGCTLVTLATTIGIIALLGSESLAFFRHVSLADFLADTQWTPLFAEPHFGIWPLVSGTLLVTAVALSLAIPFGLLAAIFLSEFAPRRLRNILQTALEVLAGVPTIVYGYFALVVVTPYLQTIVPGLAGFNALSPGLIMGIMLVPFVASLSNEALLAVPHTLREASYGLGATRLATLWHVMLPAARSGIIAAVVLALGRAIGETMIVTIAAGQQPNLTLDPRQAVETMTAFIVQISMGDAATGTLAYRSLFVVGAVLFLFTFGLNVMGRSLARRSVKGG